MANKVELFFALNVQCDGVSNTLLTNTNTTPFQWGNVSSANLSPTLSALIPSGINSLSSSDGQAVTAVVGALGAITFTWPNAPAAGLVTITGYITF